MRWSNILQLFLYLCSRASMFYRHLPVLINLVLLQQTTHFQSSKMKLFSGNNKIQPLSHWTSYAKNKKKLIVFYGEDVLDLTEFARKHPAGQKAISSYFLQDVKNILFRVYPHPKSAVDTLEKYICGKIKDHRDPTEQQQHKGISNKKQEQGKKVTFEVYTQQKKVADKQKTGASRARQKQSTLKMEENILNFEQNKPSLLVPHFDVRIFCFSKDKENKERRISDIEE